MSLNKLFTNTFLRLRFSLMSEAVELLGDDEDHDQGWKK
jgi:hypothetical protein